MKRVSFKTLGCRLNQAETADIAASFKADGWEVVSFGQACEVCVIHTCTVTSKAEKNCLRLARSIKRTNRDTKVILAGCAAEVTGNKLIELSGADMLAGQAIKFQLPSLLEAKYGHFHCNKYNGLKRADTPLLPPVFDATRAIIKVQDGCDFCCTYCIVPAARGKPWSRPFQSILDEIRALAGQGHREVVLSGANLGCYKDGVKGIRHLLAGVEKITGIDRIRISSIETSTAEREIIDYMSESSKLCHSIHIPLQSGDNQTLKNMGRRYTIDQYVNFIDYATTSIPLLGIGTDILTGFPGETDNAFENTFKLIEQLPFSNLHVFPYSKRPCTKAASMTDQIDEKIKKLRLKTLVMLGNRKKCEFGQKFIGKRVSILIESIQGHTGSDWTGEYLQAKTTISPIKRNQIVSFTPLSFSDNILQ